MKNLFNRIKQLFNPTDSLPETITKKKAATARFLVVEDNKVNQLLVKNTLRKIGISAIDFAENGNEAIDKMRNNNYDIVLMDIMLPDMKGFDVALSIRNDLKIDSAKTKIIALTAESQGKEKDHALRSGMNDFLMKPYAQDDLYRILERYIETGTAQTGTPVQLGRSEEFNIHVFEKYAGGDEQLKQKLINLFLKEIPALLNQLSGQIERNELEKGYATAHKLKNNISMLEIPSLTEKMQTLESNLLEGKETESLKTIFRFIQTRTMDILEQMKSGSGRI